MLTYKTTIGYQDTDVSGFLSLSDFRGSDGVHTFATSLLFGPILLSFSFFHDSECPARGTSPCVSPKSSVPTEI